MQTTPNDLAAFEVGETIEYPKLHGFDIQEASADALPYILSTWGRTVEMRLEAKPQSGFLKAFAKVQAKLIKRSRVLCSMKDGRIAAFMVYEPASVVVTDVDRDAKSITLGNGQSSYLHWIQTRRECSQQRHASALIAKAGFNGRPIPTFWTPDLRHVGYSPDVRPWPFWLL